MAERPLLAIRLSRRADREKGEPSKFDPNADVVRPPITRQTQRLGPKFERLRAAIKKSAGEAKLRLQEDPDGIAPERAVVFEVAGSVGDFYTQVQKIPGLEFLVEDDVEFDPDADFFSAKDRTRNLSGRLYLVMPDVGALREVLGLWDHFRRGTTPRGFTPWRSLFSLLKEVRAWGPADRVLPETVEYWRARLSSAPKEPIRFEVELWFHDNEELQQRAERHISSQVVTLGGSVVSAALVSPIRYHALLVDLPPEQIETLLADQSVGFARLDDIMFIRPQSIARFPAPEDADSGAVQDQVAELTSPMKEEPVAALLDGVPLSSHRRLTGARLILDDPDDFSARAPVSKREHGTSMASLIVHGDLAASSGALSTPLYVRPVMVYDVNNDAESTPLDRLPLDVIYLAVRRMFEGGPELPPVAPSVVLINLSLGDQNRPFSGRISPWARLLDWLAFRYRILFLVSAGNILQWLPVRAFASREEFRNANQDDREDALLQALDAEKARRTILSPSESFNALTVGASHRDDGPQESIPLHLVDPFSLPDLPNVSSGVGLGYRRTVKPDLLFDGGRELVRVSEDDGVVWVCGYPGGRSGQLVAAPDSSGTGRLDVLRKTVGSSNATALITRAAAQVYDAIEEAGYDIPREFRAVLLKALLVHGASWGDAGDRLTAIFGTGGAHHMQNRDNLSRFLGYGRPDISRVLGCIAERATLFGYGEILRDKQDEFDIPLPASLEGFTSTRRLTTTLAWLTPVNPRHQQYRSATLELLPNGDKAFSLAVTRVRAQPNHAAVDRGTVCHNVLEGANAIAFLDKGFLRLRVACRTQVGALDEPVPYAFAVSIETPVGSGIAVYDEVRAAIQPVVRTAAAG